MGIKQKNPANGRDLQNTHSLEIFLEDQVLIQFDNLRRVRKKGFAQKKEEKNV